MTQRGIHLGFCREEQAVSEPSSTRGGKGQGLMSLRGHVESPRSWLRVVGKKENDLALEKRLSPDILCWFVLLRVEVSKPPPQFLPATEGPLPCPSGICEECETWNLLGRVLSSRRKPFVQGPKRCWAAGGANWLSVELLTNPEMNTTEEEGGKRCS